MIYAKIKNGDIDSIIDRPLWFFDNGEMVDDEFLATEGIYPVDTNPPTEDTDRYRLVINDVSEFIIDEENKVVGNYYTVVAKSVGEVFNERCREVDKIRDNHIYTDVDYEFPSGTGTIQLRNDADIRNITSMVLEALKDVINNEPTKQHVFLDASNTMREMTASQVVEMGSYIKAVGQEIFNISWNHKHVNLQEIFNNPSLSDEDKINQIIDYNIHDGWYQEDE